MSDWRDAPIDLPRIGPLGWLLVFLRGGVLGTLTYGSLLVLLAVRLIERPLWGATRPLLSR